MTIITKPSVVPGGTKGQANTQHKSNEPDMKGVWYDNHIFYKMKNQFGKAMMMAVLLLFALVMKVEGQYCSTPLPGMNQYSRVIHPNSGTTFNTNEWMQADFDSSNANVYIPSTLVHTGSNSDFWANVHTNGVMNSISGVSINGTEKAYAVKRDYATGDIITAGSIVIVSGGSHTVLFVMRQTSTGSVLWCNYYLQANTPITNHVVVTIAKNGDIIAASSTLSSTDDIIIVRMQFNGTMQYYEDQKVTNSGNTTEAFPTINGITATTDNGFVLVGSSGYGPSRDYVQAMVIMFDQGYSGSSSSTLNWTYTYRSYRSTYNLNISGERSSSYANGVIEDLGHILLVVGYTTDADQNGVNATYENGFIFSLDSTGRRIIPTGDISTFSGNSGDFVRFNSVCTDQGSAIPYITGWVKSGTNGSYKTLVASFTYGETSTMISNVYGSGSSGAIDKGFLIYPLLGLASVVSVGISNEYTGSSTEPHELSVDINGNSQSASGCSSSYALTYDADLNDSVPLSSSVQSQSTPSSISTTVNGICENMEDICGGCPAETPASQTYYSRVMDNNFYLSPPQTTQITMQADQDASGNIITANRIWVNGRYEILLTSTAPDGTVNFSKDFWINETSPYNYQDDAKAVKVAANGDIIVAGLMDLKSGHAVIFLMRVSSTGSLIWQNYYSQTAVDLSYGNVVVTETSGGDIVAVASPSPFANVSFDDMDMLRVSSSGGVRYHVLNTIQASTPGSMTLNSTEHHPFIRGIVATSNNDYVICGTTGQDGDYYGALIARYDNNYTSATQPTQLWAYVLAKPPTSLPYSLISTQAHRSVNSANAITFDGTYIYVAGNTDNSDTSMRSATFRYGFILKLTYAGASTDIKEIQPSSGLLNLFGITLNSSGYYVLTGSSLVSSSLNTVAMIINPSTSALVDGSTYGISGSTDYGCSIFDNGSTGYLMAGFTYDNTMNNSYPFLQTNLLSVDNSLVLGTDCYDSYAPDIIPDPTYNTAIEKDNYSPNITNSQSVTITKYDLCGGMFDLCASASAQTMFPIFKGSGRNDLRYTVDIYPNPAANSLSIDLGAGSSSAGLVSIMDMEGRVVSTSQIQIANGNNHYDMDISGLKPGLYFVKLVSDNGTSYPVTKISKP